MMGGEFDHSWSQTREAVLAMKELWTKEEAEYHGNYVDFPPLRSFPKPVQKPYPPVYLGSQAPRTAALPVLYVQSLDDVASESCRPTGRGRRVRRRVVAKI